MTDTVPATRPQAGASLPGTEYRVGDPVAGPREVVGLLGQGGAGLVLLARDPAEGDLVAIKTLRPELRGVPEARTAFHREALAWARLGPHPNVLRAREVVGFAEDLFLVMDYVPPAAGQRGASLRHRLWKCGALPLAQVLRWAVELCRGMEHAYSCGLLCHRDLKPENLLVGPDETVRIADFGLALTSGCDGAQGGGCGDPRYMPPEQFGEAGVVDVRSDVYSFGIVLHELLTGELPFGVPLGQGGRHRPERAAWWSAWERAHRYETPKGSDSPLAPVVSSCSARDPRQRYADFRLVRQALEERAASLGVAVADPLPVDSPWAGRLAKGSMLLALGYPGDALGHFDAALRDRRDDGAGRAGRARSLLRLGRPEEALADFEALLKACPSDPAALDGAGTALDALGQGQRAEERFRAALDVDPLRAEVWHHRGRSLAGLGHSDEALACYVVALDVLISRKRREEALSVVTEGLGRFPDNGRLLQLRAWAARLRGGEEELGKSLNALSGAWAVAQDDPETAGILAGTYKRLWFSDSSKRAGLLERAFQLYHGAWVGSGRRNTYVGINAATLALLLGRPRESRALAQQVKVAYDARTLADLLAQGARYSSYWDRVTLAEAELLLGRLGRARRLYRGVMEVYEDRRAYLDSSTDQLDLILPRLGLSVTGLTFLSTQASPPTVEARWAGVIGNKGRGSCEGLREHLQAVFAGLRERLPRHVGLALLTPLREGSERTAAAAALAAGVPITAVVSGEMGELLARLDSDSEEELRGILNGAEEIRVLDEPEDRDAEARHVAAHADLLLRIDADDRRRPDETAAAPAAVLRIAPDGAKPPDPKDLDAVVAALPPGRKPMTYTPKPIDTSHIQLSDDLLELKELLAENAHEIWAKQRLSEGWAYGPQRNDATREHPDLVPYDDLPGSEKEYDRSMAMETLKVIRALGYRIEKR